jgi:hypothetical protein
MSARPVPASGQLLREAAELVGGDRNKQHGSKLENMTKIAAMWNAYLGNRGDMTQRLRPHEVADLMELMKVARRQSGTFNRDDYLDAAGYASIAFEVREKLS